MWGGPESGSAAGMSMAKPIYKWLIQGYRQFRKPPFGKRKKFNVSKNRLNCSPRSHVVHGDAGKFVLELLPCLVKHGVRHLGVAIVPIFGWVGLVGYWKFEMVLQLGVTPSFSKHLLQLAFPQTVRTDRQRWIVERIRLVVRHASDVCLAPCTDTWRCIKWTSKSYDLQYFPQENIWKWPLNRVSLRTGKATHLSYHILKPPNRLDIIICPPGCTHTHTPQGHTGTPTGDPAEFLFDR